MSCQRSSRRCFLQSLAGSAAAGGLAVNWPVDRAVAADQSKAKNDRPHLALIGAGGRGTHVAKWAAQFAEIVAVCDVDRKNAERAKAQLGDKADLYDNYQKLLQRKDVEGVINGTPDHWHTAINIAACKAGKDVYAEKPLTLTIDEGKLLRQAVRDSGQVFQVGTQQRSEKQFQTACELVRNGRIGRLKQVYVLLPFWNTKGGPFPTQPVPEGLDWDMYQGQAPLRDYCPERTHFNYRWWFEYAGGIVCDWGQHHMDIAHWGMDVEKSGPLEIEAKADFPNGGKADCYNNPDRFVARLKYPNDVDLTYLVVRDAKYLKSMSDGDIPAAADAELFAGLPEELKTEQRNGIMFIGDAGRVMVNRGGVFGKAAEELAENPLPSDGVRLGRSDDHMRNFIECMKTRAKPVTDVDIAHRVITACHLSNIAIRLERPIRWDSQAEVIVGDEEASGWLRREQRSPYGIGSSG